MKVIELLTKIANGEKIPKKIKYQNYIYEYQHRRDTENCFNYMCNENGEYLSRRYFIDNILNDEVEIIEDKKIKKLDVDKIYERKYLCDDISIDNLRLVNKRLSNNWDKLRKWLSDKYYGLNGHMDSDIIEIKDVLNYINELKGVENNE